MATQAKLVVESPFFNVSPNIVSTLDSNSKFSHRSSLRFQTMTTRRRVSLSTAAAATTTPPVPPPPPIQDEQRKPPDLQILMRRFWKVAVPYWSSDDKVQARLQLAAVFALTLGTTGISVGFSFLGRDFYNALANKDQEQFTKQLLYYLAGFAGGIPFFVLRDYAREKLSLRWRSWMTSYYMERYLKNKTFYKIQSQSTIDNPDQRIVDDLSSFTGTALSFSLTLFNAAIDLISFSNILFGIYPPLFGVLLAYSLGGTALSVFLGKGLVSLNFLQEKKEADFRYGLVRVRENAESIAFYGGEENEMQLLLSRFRSAFENLNQLLISSRNLDFFTSGYRYLIQILPAAVVAPMYFSGKIEFGVINQSVSAFNHILGDFSLIVYQFQALSAFSAVIDRLGMLFLDGAFFSKYMEKRFTPPKLMEALLVLPRLQKNGFAGDPLIGTTTWTEFEAKSWNADVISCRIEDDEEFYPPRESLDGRESLIGTGSASRRAFTSIEVKSFGGSSSSSSYSSSSSASGSPVRSLSLSISLLVSLSPKNSQSKSLDLLVVHTAPPPQNPYPPSLLLADFVPILVINGESDSPSPPSSSSPKRYPSRSIDTGEFDDVLDSNSKKGDQDSKEKIQLNFCLISSSNGLHSNGSMPLSKRVKLLHVEHLTVQTPSEATLIKDLSFEIFEKDYLLVTGPSGSGKTSLLRVIAGLWSFGNGAITVYVRPRGDLEMLHSPDVVSYQVTSTNETIGDSTGRRNFEGVIFLPQKPYMVLGTLRQQLLYPTWTKDSDNLSDDAKQSDSVPFLMRARDARCVNERSKKPTSEDLLQVLNDVSLGHLLSRFDGLDSTHEWSSVLSLGEQQRLAFGRLLLSKPTLALLDESTSALDEANEARLYQLIQAAGITYISIGHRRTLYKYHKKVLHVSTADSTSTQQNWSFKDVEEDPIYNFSKQ